ncbi:hypothetical protein SAMN04489752_3464 [Brevibacterium siliguriense]|uniref:Uncharacterized protein n=1 Tax=Brevibacterium siliguriense TaxID=1136497 RepID=A0A1H1XWV7_9MICO|nr:DUF6882 domain-containing protein [Brevibacterium siliguriense]SDT13714.1 hypothetical protein SAMN04489752_3464 [Brevibacterium siliguriense]
MSSTLQDLVNRAVFYSTEVQTHFGALISDAEWEVDFSSDPHLTFTSADGAVLRTRPHLLGSESDREKTWLWGWENVNDFPDAVVGLSHEVRKFGAAEEVTELTTPEISLDEELALRLTLASKEATDNWAHYPAAAGAGTTVWLLVEAAEIALPTPQVKVSVRALMQGLTQTTVTDHRAAIESYVAKRGIPTADLPEGGMRMLFADGSADLSFDDQRRISNCDLNAPLEGEAAEQFAAAAGSTGTPTEAAASSRTPGSASAPAAEEAAAPAATAPSAPAPAPVEEPSRTETQPVEEPAAEATPTAETQADDAAEPAAEAADASTQDKQPEVEQSAGDEPVEPAAAKTPIEEEPAKEAKPKKKGLFSKLFGR